MSIQTHIRNDRGETEELHPNDPRYWEGPYVYTPYPKLLFKASVGRYQDSDQEQIVVQSEREHRALGSDWCESPDLARQHCDRMEAEIARAAAEVKASATRMSASAQAELRAAEVATDEHVTDVTPKRKGWPKGKPRAKKEPADVSQ